MRGLLKSLLLPPLSCLLLVAAGVLLRRRRPRLGRALVVFGVGSLWLLSTPWVAAGLFAGLQTCAPIDIAGDVPPADAIVVLSADTASGAPEFSGSTVGPLALARLRYAAALHRRTGRPILVTGGVVGSEPRPHAEMMRDVLAAEFGVPVKWLETKSTNTWENARGSAEVLAGTGVRRVFLVTHAWHMPRARWSFEAVGLEVVPAPTAYARPPASVLGGVLPHWSALRDSAYALHEWLGRAWYIVAA